MSAQLLPSCSIFRLAHLIYTVMVVQLVGSGCHSQCVSHSVFIANATRAVFMRFEKVDSELCEVLGASPHDTLTTAFAHGKLSNVMHRYDGMRVFIRALEQLL